MPWPLSQDYNEAIQSPEVSFSDPELRVCEAKCNAIGIPMPRSGNFADVYEMTAPSGKKWALKCFTRQVAGLRERYAAISAYLKQVNLPFMVDFTYLEQGVRVKGQWYPALKMQWVEGFTFNEFVKEYADQPQHLDLLSQIWLRLARRLREARMAHADLQHGNVLLVPGAKATSLGVRLIDYDGMFVPALADKKSGEVGHPAYQHPQRLREGIYSAEVDRFPHLVIYTALRSLMVGGRYLWSKYDNGDNLLFRQQDLDNPEKSALFAELRKLSDGEVGKLVTALAQAARQPLEETPLLDTLVADRTSVTPRRKPTVPEEPSAESVFAAATAGDDVDAATFARRRPVKKSNPWMWAAAGLALLAVGLAGVVFFLSGKDPKDTRSDGLAAANSATKVPDKQAPDGGQKADPNAGKQAVPKVDPDAGKKLEPRADPKGDPKNDPPPPLPPVGPRPQSFQGHTSSVHTVAFSPDGQRIASAGNDQTVRLWQSQTGQLERTLQGFPQAAKGLAFSPDGKQLVVGYWDGTIKVWDPQTGQEQRSSKQHNHVVASVAFSPDGKHLVSGSFDKTLKEWDAQTWQVERTLQGHTGGVQAVAWSPDGQSLISAASDNQLKLWGAGSGVENLSLNGLFMSGLTFSPDGKYMIAAGADQTVRVWTAIGREVHILHGHSGSVRCVAMTPDGKRIISGSVDNTLKVWNAQTGEVQLTLKGHNREVLSVAVSPDGKRLVSGSADTTVKVWSLPETIPGPPVVEPGAVAQQLLGHNARVNCVAFSPDGKRALSGSDDSTARIWEIPSGKQLERIDRPDPVFAVAWSSDTKLFALACGDRRGRAGFVVLDPDNKKGGKGFGYNGDAVTVPAVVFVPNQQKLLAGFSQGDIGVALYSEPTKLTNVRPPDRTSLHALALSADGTHYIVGGKDGFAVVYEAETHREKCRLVGHQGDVLGVALNRDASQAVTCGGTREIRVWNTRTGGTVREIRDHQKRVTCLALSSDGQRLVTGSDDKTVHVWDLTTGKMKEFRGHSAEVTSVALSSDGRWVLSASNDQSLRLWDLSK